MFQLPSIWRVWTVALVISIGGSFHYGYQLSAINPTENIIRDFFNSSRHTHYGGYFTESDWTYFWPVVVNSQSIGRFITTFFLKVLLENVPRKRCFYVTNSVMLLVTLFQGLADPSNVFELFVLGRFLSGLVQGVHLGFQPVYFIEISPRAKRGLIGSMTGFMLEFGFLLASILALPPLLGSEGIWPYLFLIEAVPSLVALCVLPFIPESPKFLASKNRFEEAELSLRKLGRTEEEIKEELAETRRELTKNLGETDSMSLREVFTTDFVRKGLLLAWLVVLSSSFSGITPFSVFSTKILTDAGLSHSDAQFAILAVTAPCCLGALMGGPILDRFGRRPIILFSTAFILICNVLFMILAHLGRVYSIQWTGYASIAVASMICLMFGIGPASVQWFIAVELMPQRAKSTAHTLTMILQRIFSTIAGLTFYPLLAAVNEFSFFMHVIPLTVALTLLTIWLPETKNRTSDEVVDALKIGRRKKKTKIFVEKF